MNRLVAIGASAGGVEALRVVLGGLPPTFDAPVCVAMHTAPQSPGVLHEILGRATGLTVVSAQHADRLSPGRVYVAPPDRHLLVEPGRVCVTRGPHENRFRPAVDPLFRSAAQVYGPGAMGVVLTGNLDDGTTGLWAIKRLGGVAVVQDPADALFPSMPASAAAHVEIDHCVPLAGIAPLLARLVSSEPLTKGGITVPDDMDIEVKIAKEQDPLEAGLARVAEPSPYACPECHGVLLQMKESGPLRFRCHTGHAYSLESLLAQISEAIDESMRNTVRALQESGMLMSRLAEHLERRHDSTSSSQLAERAGDLRRQASGIRQMIGAREPLTGRTR